MTVIQLPVDARAALRRWLNQWGCRDAARSLTRNRLVEVLALVPTCNRTRARALVEALLEQRRRHREARRAGRAEDETLWRDDPVLREARACFLRARRERLWLLEARELLRKTYAAAVLELLRRRGVQPTLESIRAAAREVRQAVRAQRTLRVLPGGRS